MNIPTTSKVTQHIVTILLLVVLVGIVAAYIYYGMNRAGQMSEVPGETTAEPVDTSTDDARRQEILKALESAPEINDTQKREEIMADLEAESAVSVTPEDMKRREEILEALQ